MNYRINNIAKRTNARRNREELGRAKFRVQPNDSILFGTNILESFGLK